MRVPFADLHLQYETVKGEIDGAIASVIRDSAFIRGSYVDSFEREFAAAVDVKHCVSCANGTDALYLAMAALKVKPGDEVITTAHSWISGWVNSVSSISSAETFSPPVLMISTLLRPRMR